MSGGAKVGALHSRYPLLSGGQGRKRHMFHGGLRWGVMLWKRRERELLVKDRRWGMSCGLVPLRAWDVRRLVSVYE